MTTLATAAAPPVRPASFDALAARLTTLCDPYPFHTGWYLKDLRSGEVVARHGDVVVPSASTRKIAILMAALRDVATGALSLDQPVTIEPRYQISNSGVFQHFRPGFAITLHDVLTMMIVVSDNACTGTVADMLGLDRINEFSRGVGMRNTTHREGIPASTVRVQAAARPGARGERAGGVGSVGNAGNSGSAGGVNETTPEDVGLLLELILQGSTDAAVAARLGSTTELCRLALDILSWQKLNTRLPLLLPLGTRVAHKTGTGAHTYNDAGIVYGKRAGGEDEARFILTVYTHKVPAELPPAGEAAPYPFAIASAPGATSLLIATLARTCWDALT